MNHETLITAPLRDGSCVEHSAESLELIHPHRILIADDDELIRHLISGVLSDAGFDVNAAADGNKHGRRFTRSATICSSPTTKCLASRGQSSSSRFAKKA